MPESTTKILLKDCSGSPMHTVFIACTTISGTALAIMVLAKEYSINATHITHQNVQEGPTKAQEKSEETAEEA